MSNIWKIKNTRDKAYELIEEGVVSYQQMAEACLQYMSTDDIEGMLISNELIEEGVVSYQQMAEACLQYMSTDDIEGMLISNEMIEVEEVTR